MSKINFIIPPSFDEKVKPAERTAGCTRVVYPMPNIYELIVVSLLERHGHDVSYLDYVLDNKSSSKFENEISNHKVDFFCFWTVNLSIDTDIEALSIIRRYHPITPVLFMGPGATFFISKLLLDEKCFVLRGEPEYTVIELVDLLFNGSCIVDCKGISYLDKGEVVHNLSRKLISNLDELPFPARHHIDHYQYSNPKLKQHPYTTLLTSRNCPFQCIYCVPSSLTFAREIEHKSQFKKKPPVSFRSTDNVIEEIDALAASGYKSIAIIDDNFITTIKRLRPICERLKFHDISWGCQARVDAITEEVAQVLSQTNCKFVDLGVESFNDEILAYIKKGITSEQIESGITLLNKYDVPVKLNILIGTSPLETKKTIKETVTRAKKLNASQVMYNIVSPFPGTEFYDLAKKNKWIEGGEYTPTDVQRHSILNYPNLNSTQMDKLLFWSNLRFFLSPKFIFNNITKFSSFHDFHVALKALKTKLFG